MNLEETTPKFNGENNTCLIDFFELAAMKENGPCLPLPQLVKLLEKRDTFWSSPSQSNKTTIYSAKVDLPYSPFSHLNLIPLDFIVGKIQCDYKLVVSESVGREKSELRAVYFHQLHHCFQKASYYPQVRKLFEEVEKIDSLKRNLSGSDRDLRAAAALELYLID